MAQSSSAQREPSMEEILASIRRIIEDSDTTRGLAEQAQPAPQAAEPAERPALAQVADIQAFRTSSPEPVLEDAPAASPAPEPAMQMAEPAIDEAPSAPPAALSMLRELAPSLAVVPSLAPVAEQPKAAEPVAADVKAPEPVATKPEPVAASFEIPAPAAAIVEAAEPVTEPLAAAPAEARIEVPASAPEELVPTITEELAADFEDPLLSIQDLLDDELQREIETAVAQAPEPAADTASAPAPIASIISDRTGRQVAAAFGELSEAFAATRQKSFDEMAEAMIRPMLSEWLDNNLPTLVERLVREEIERIARGPVR